MHEKCPVVKVEVLIDWDKASKVGRTTQSIFTEGRVTEKGKLRYLVSEHSPIRVVEYLITFINVPYYVAMHLRTHQIGWTDPTHEQYYIQSQRNDVREANGFKDIPRGEKLQNHPVTFDLKVNPQALINTSRVRLCKKADVSMRELWEDTILAVSEVDKHIRDVCVPNCIYRGFCPEMKPCGYALTSTYTHARYNYVELCKRGE
jgi:hypothetical protein